MKSRIHFFGFRVGKNSSSLGVFGSNQRALSDLFSLFVYPKICCLHIKDKRNAS